MTEALTVRLRQVDGRHSLWLAPAGGMGLSFPCCAAGHARPESAFDCGATRLRERLLPPPELPDLTSTPAVFSAA